MSYTSMLTAGKRKRTYCKYQEMVPSDDGQGGFTDVWTTVYPRLLVRMNALKGREQALLWQKQTILADYTIFLNYVTGIKTGGRLVKLDDARMFEIKLFMNYDEDSTMLRLECLESKRGE